MTNVNAVEMYAYARRYGIKPKRGDASRCARGILGVMSLPWWHIDKYFWFGYCRRSYMRKKYNLTDTDIRALENGFEGFSVNTDNPYWKVGRDLAFMAGYDW